MKAAEFVSVAGEATDKPAGPGSTET